MRSPEWLGWPIGIVSVCRRVSSARNKKSESILGTVRKKNVSFRTPAPTWYIISFFKKWSFTQRHHQVWMNNHKSTSILSVRYCDSNGSLTCQCLSQHGISIFKIISEKRNNSYLSRLFDKRRITTYIHTFSLTWLCYDWDSNSRPPCQTLVYGSQYKCFTTELPRSLILRRESSTIHTILGSGTWVLA